MKSYKRLYSQSLTSLEGQLHFAAHSHHLWPDVSVVGQTKYALDAIQFADKKWDVILGEEIKKTQQIIASYINFSNPEQISFAPNTNTLFFRLFSSFNLECFTSTNPLKIITTDSEFASFNRQINRISELKNIEIKKISLQPYETFSERFTRELKANSYQIVFISRVFYNSGFVFNPLKDVIELQPDAMIVLDDYHGFCAIPFDLKPFEDKIFYMAGSYKYAQGGEGLCFMTSPKNNNLRPLYTGWFADYSALGNPMVNAEVDYSSDGYRFWGSTVDLSPCYRFNAVHSLFKSEGLNIGVIHSHVDNLKKIFFKCLKSSKQNLLDPSTLILFNESLPESHFLTLRTSRAKSIYETLDSARIITDYRGDRLRFGFGLYQDIEDIEMIFARLEKI